MNYTHAWTVHMYQTWIHISTFPSQWWTCTIYLNLTYSLNCITIEERLHVKINILSLSNSIIALLPARALCFWQTGAGWLQWFFVLHMWSCWAISNSNNLQTSRFYKLINQFVHHLAQFSSYPFQQLRERGRNVKSILELNWSICKDFEAWWISHDSFIRLHTFRSRAIRRRDAIIFTNDVEHVKYISGDLAGPISKILLSTPPLDF